MQREAIIWVERVTIKIRHERQAMEYCTAG